MSPDIEGVQPLTDRRSFLRRTVAAFAAATAGTTTAFVATLPATALVVVVEDPAIVALGERIDPRLAAYRNAAEDRLQARARAEATCPAVPEEIVCTSSFWRGLTDDECDVEGKEIRVLFAEGKDGKMHATLPRQILNSEKTKAAIARGNLHCDRRTRFGKDLMKKIEVAERYETERAAAIERTGLPTTMARQWEAAYAIEQLAYDARDVEPRTMAGALVQARVLAAYAGVEIEVGHYHGRAGQLVGLALAQSLTRLSVV